MDAVQDALRLRSCLSYDDFDVFFYINEKHLIKVVRHIVHADLQRKLYRAAEVRSPLQICSDLGSALLSDPGRSPMLSGKFRLSDVGNAGASHRGTALDSPRQPGCGERHSVLGRKNSGRRGIPRLTCSWTPCTGRWKRLDSLTSLRTGASYFFNVRNDVFLVLVSGQHSCS